MINFFILYILKNLTILISVSYLLMWSTLEINNNQLILEGMIRTMPQLTERNQLM